jgi:hypothetical protein
LCELSPIKPNKYIISMWQNRTLSSPKPVAYMSQAQLYSKRNTSLYKIDYYYHNSDFEKIEPYKLMLVYLTNSEYYIFNRILYFNFRIYNF